MNVRIGEFVHKLFKKTLKQMKISSLCRSWPWSKFIQVQGAMNCKAQPYLVKQN